MDYQNLTKNELLTMRAYCDESLLFFTRFWFRVLRNQKFIVGEHHIITCSEIEKLLNYEYELLNINMPPRCSKTEIAAVNTIARGIGMNPKSNWLYITASDELRSQTSVSIRDIVSHPYFYEMYGVQLKKDQNAKNLWRTNEGGGLKTATIFGQITGFGAGQMIDHSELESFIREFEGCIVLDDINKIDDATLMNAINTKVSRIIFNTILSRKNSRDTPIINIQQRAGMEDATAQFLKHYKDSEKAKFLIMPVIDETGKLLWEWKYNLEDIERLKTSEETCNIFGTQYMQMPVPLEGLLFPKNEIKYYEVLPEEPDFILINIDPADEGKDHLNCNLYLVKDEKVYIAEVIYTRDNSTITIPRIEQLVITSKANYLRCESNGGWMIYYKEIRRRVEELGLNCECRYYNSNKNKELRIYNEAPTIINRFLFARTQNAEYTKAMTALTKYQKMVKDQEDDFPDNLAAVSQHLKKTGILTVL